MKTITFTKSILIHRFTILIASFVGAYLLYSTLIQIIDADLSIRPPSNTDYTFFSGNMKGVYYDIAERVKDKNPNFIKENKETNGSEENKVRILHETKAFAFVYSNLLLTNQNKIDEVQELYEGKLHIIYKTKSVKFNEKKEIKILPRIIKIGKDNSQNEVLKFLINNSYMSIGQSGSSTTELAKYILEEIDPNKTYFGRINEMKLSDAIKHLYTDSIQMLFFISGHNNTFKDILNSDDYGLINIDKDFISYLKNKRLLNLDLSDFKKSDYQDPFKENQTFAISNYLVASKGIPYYDKQKILEYINTVKGNITAIDKDYNFLDTFKNNNKKYWFPVRLTIFLTLLTIFSLFLFHLLTWTVSELNRITYFRELKTRS